MDFRKIASILSVVTIGTAAAIWWHSPTNYEDCMLSEMKGQNMSLWQIAHAKCGRKSGKEFSMSAYDQHWEYSYPNVFVSIPESNGMKARRGVFQFSSKECKDTSPPDFIVHRPSIAVEDGGFVITMLPNASEYAKGFSKPVCMQISNLMGVFR